MSETKTIKINKKFKTQKKKHQNKILKKKKKKKKTKEEETHAEPNLIKELNNSNNFSPTVQANLTSKRIQVTLQTFLSLNYTYCVVKTNHFILQNIFQSNWVCV